MKYQVIAKIGVKQENDAEVVNFQSDDFLDIENTLKTMINNFRKFSLPSDEVDELIIKIKVSR